jgi:hypothetical protein
MAENKDAKSCCQHDSAKDAKESCCSGKDTGGNQPMSCMQEKAKSAGPDAANCCGKSDHKTCGARSEKDSEQSGMACCGGSVGQCGMQHHEHEDVGK